MNEIQSAVRDASLEVFGITKDNDESIVLLGPREPGFWNTFTSAPEYKDGAPDPMDRWSIRVITALAEQLGGRAVFPFGGPPYAPFQRWATESGRAWASPVGFLVHDTAGLWVSFRGALVFPYAIEQAPPAQRPCDSCHDRPCLSACPVGALSDRGYDLAKCHGYLDEMGRTDCMMFGCNVRRSCPAGADYGRLDAQSAFHMRNFHK